jgi:hypothetical protein
MIHDINMKGYVKLFGDILTSSVWTEPSHVRLVWITLLALSDADGSVRASIPGLASVARVDLRECQEALRIFEAPDEFSRSTEHEGRRLEKIEGGWKILNYEKFRSRLSRTDRREYHAHWMREHRKKLKSLGRENGQRQIRV